MHCSFLNPCPPLGGNGMKTETGAHYCCESPFDLSNLDLDDEGHEVVDVGLLVPRAGDKFASGRPQKKSSGGTRGLAGLLV